MKKFLLATLIVSTPALADPRTDCPTPAPCKVVILSLDEERALTGPNNILDTAMAARALDWTSAVGYFKSKIDKAPAGDVPKAPEPPKPPVDKN